MKISGLQKTTLLDFPGRVAATIFTAGCNFRCPFCHNSDLLDGGEDGCYSEEEVLDFLIKRRNILEGVCISGGEPTLQPDLESFIRQIRKIGLAVKLDTNGYRPDVLKMLCRKGLLDYIAMDIKASREHYTQVSGVSRLHMEKIDESIEFLLSGRIAYEFRTTVVRGLHSSEDFRQMGPWIEGCLKYFLQCFTESGNILLPGVYSEFSKKEMCQFAEIIRPYVGQVSLRGIDY